MMFIDFFEIEGAVITRARIGSDNITRLGTDSLWFVAETNYDNWKPQPIFDDRLTPCIKCLKQKGQSQVNFESLFNVLSSRPMLNKVNYLFDLLISFKIYFCRYYSKQYTHL